MSVEIYPCISEQVLITYLYFFYLEAVDRIGLPPPFLDEVVSCLMKDMVCGQQAMILAWFCPKSHFDNLYSQYDHIVHANLFDFLYKIIYCIIWSKGLY